MRYLYIFTLLAIAAIGPVQGQDEDCRWWRNPMAFGYSYEGTPGPTTFRGWSARVGERCYSSGNYNDTTDGYTIKSTCSDPNSPAILGHSTITSSTYYSGSDNFSCSNLTGVWDHNDHRFQIITSDNAGLVGYTVNPATPSVGMPRIPEGYTSCIRLGDLFATGQAQSGNCNYLSTSPNKGSEALFYTLQVTPENALLQINYAIVARKYDHTAYDAGEFCIRVVEQNDDGTWPNAPINDSLCYKVSAPHYTGALPAPWLDGLPGPDYGGYTCGFVYKPWTKVAISLSAYLYKIVRVEMYTSDCNWNVDPLMAYICGDYQPMKISSSGCADAQSDAIDTLKAPEGLTQYTWYVTTEGAVDNHYNTAFMESVHFRQLTQPSDNIIYTPTLADFVLTEGPNAGDTVATQTFMCTMVSALDPNKPFMSKVYQNVENSKPTPEIRYSTDCNLTVHLSDESFTYASENIDLDSTRWIVYADSMGSAVLDTLWGGQVDYQFPTDGYYRVSMRTVIFGKSCSSIKDVVCRVLQPHEVPIEMAETELCEGETAVAWAVGGEGYEKVWSIDDSVAFSSDATNSYDTIRWTPTVGSHILTLTTTTDGQCPATTSIAFKVIGNSTITSSVDASLICRGDSVTLNAAGIDSPRWVSTPYDSSLVGTDGQNIVTVMPQVTTTYTVQPMGDSRCLQNASDITIMVLPYPIPTIYTNKPALELTNPKLHIEDRSPNSTSSHWTFSDGYADEGSSIDHYFGSTGDSVWIALHACNEERCCADTTIWLPVQINVLWIPNTFTPNREPNGHFTFFTTLEMTYYEIWIYNRQGLLVYHGTDINQPWDGTDINGNACPQGAYVYHYVYSCTQDPDRKHPGDGTVTLLR